MGSVKREVYKAYISSWSAWLWLPIAVVLIAFGERTLQVRGSGQRGARSWLPGPGS